ncbi:hypothetical protein J6590_082262 [Homalodisca vitripennis]|nr:hypothetical protein J6590_082262 [Homalodisca vitripennis]
MSGENLATLSRCLAERPSAKTAEFGTGENITGRTAKEQKPLELENAQKSYPGEQAQMAAGKGLSEVVLVPQWHTRVRCSSNTRRRRGFRVRSEHGPAAVTRRLIFYGIDIFPHLHQLS